MNIRTKYCVEKSEDLWFKWRSLDDPYYLNMVPKFLIDEFKDEVRGGWLPGIGRCAELHFIRGWALYMTPDNFLDYSSGWSYENVQEYGRELVVAAANRSDNICLQALAKYITSNCKFDESILRLHSPFKNVDIIEYFSIFSSSDRVD